VEGLWRKSTKSCKESCRRGGMTKKQRREETKARQCLVMYLHQPSYCQDIEVGCPKKFVFILNLYPSLFIIPFHSYASTEAYHVF
jgi:hypothetical protein